MWGSSFPISVSWLQACELLVWNQVDVSSVLVFVPSLTPSVRLFSYLKRSLHVAIHEMVTDVIESKVWTVVLCQFSETIDTFRHFRHFGGMESCPLFSPFLFRNSLCIFRFSNGHIAIDSAHILLLVRVRFHRCSTEWTRSRLDFDLARSGEGMRHTPHVQFSNPSGHDLEHDGHCFLGNFAQLIQLKGSQSLTCLFGFLTELVESFFLSQVWNDRLCLICRSKLVHEFLHFGHSSLIFEHCILWNSLNLGDPQFPSAGGLPLLESGPCCWCCFN